MSLQVTLQAYLLHGLKGPTLFNLVSSWNLKGSDLLHLVEISPCAFPLVRCALACALPTGRQACSLCLEPFPPPCTLS